MLDEYLKENGSSRYQIFKAVGIPQSTLSFYAKKQLKDYPVRILVAIGQTIDKPSWLVLKELIDVEKHLLCQPNMVIINSSSNYHHLD